MKKLLLLVVCVFFTHTTFAQKEREQKIQKVEEKRSSSSTQINNNNSFNQGYQSGYNSGLNDGIWGGRTRIPYYYSPYDVGYYPYWNTRRRWDNRDYVMTTSDNLIQSNPRNPTRLSFGVLVEQDMFQSQISPYIITGGESFMIIQYHTTLPLIYPYYDNISTWEVQDWGDESAGTVEVKGDFSIGVGRTIERYSPFAMVGITTRRTYDGYIDEYHVLSSESQDGIYLINEQKQINMSIRGGFLFHWEYVEIISQLRYDGRLGAGFGIGLKL